MNPRGKQFALGGAVTGWTRLGSDAPPEVRRLVRRVYRGWEPRVYSRYGVRQWSAPLPRTRLVVKDPFALLSLPFLTEVTGATAVVLFRHPAAMLQSYRRMGWSPAVAEARALGLASPDGSEPPDVDDPVASMAWFWSACYQTVLGDLDRVPHAVVVDHAELSHAGEHGVRRVAEACGLGTRRLAPANRSRSRLAVPGARGAGRAKPPLHNFERTAEEVTHGWREALPQGEAERMESLTATTWSALRTRRLALDTDMDQNDLRRGARG